MENKKILEVARKNTTRGKEYESKALEKSNTVGIIVSTIVGCALFWLEYFIRHTLNIGLVAVCLAAVGIQSLYEGIKIKKTRLIIVGSVETIMAVVCVLIFIVQVVAL